MSNTAFKQKSSSRQDGKSKDVYVGPYLLGKTLGEGSSGVHFSLNLETRHVYLRLVRCGVLSARLSFQVLVLLTRLLLGHMSSYIKQIAKVKLGIHKDTGQRVAVKILSKEAFSETPGKRQRVEREIAVMKLMDHPHVMRLLDVMQTSHHLFLILEHVEGGELFDFLVSGGRMGCCQAFDFFQQIISGVEYCHKRLICHRDLKPENVLLDKDRKIKIADFGMATLMKEGDGNFCKTSCGSPHYASPEVIRGGNYNGMDADIWSIGVMLFSLVSCKLPFDDDNVYRLLQKVKAGRYVMPDYLPPALKDLISRMLNVNPNARIKLSEIKMHPWYQEHSQHQHAQEELQLLRSIDESDNQTVIPLFKIHDDGSFDTDIFYTIQSLGWRDARALKAALLSDSASLERVVYSLLLSRKQKIIAQTQASLAMEEQASQALLAPAQESAAASSGPLSVSLQEQEPAAPPTPPAALAQPQAVQHDTLQPKGDQHSLRAPLEPQNSASLSQGLSSLVGQSALARSATSSSTSSSTSSRPDSDGSYHTPFDDDPYEMLLPSCPPQVLEQEKNLKIPQAEKQQEPIVLHQPTPVRPIDSIIRTVDSPNLDKAGNYRPAAFEAALTRSAKSGSANSAPSSPLHQGRAAAPGYHDFESLPATSLHAKQQRHHHHRTPANHFGVEQKISISDSVQKSTSRSRLPVLADEREQCHRSQCAPFSASSSSDSFSGSTKNFDAHPKHSIPSSETPPWDSRRLIPVDVRLSIPSGRVHQEQPMSPKTSPVAAEEEAAHLQLRKPQQHSTHVASARLSRSQLRTVSHHQLQLAMENSVDVPRHMRRRSSLGEIYAVSSLLTKARDSSRTIPRSASVVSSSLLHSSSCLPAHLLDGVYDPLGKWKKSKSASDDMDHNSATYQRLEPKSLILEGNFSQASDDHLTGKLNDEIQHHEQENATSPAAQASKKSWFSQLWEKLSSRSSASPSGSQLSPASSSPGPVPSSPTFSASSKKPVFAGLVFAASLQDTCNSLAISLSNLNIEWRLLGEAVFKTRFVGNSIVEVDLQVTVLPQSDNEVCIINFLRMSGDAWASRTLISSVFQELVSVHTKGID